MRTYPITVTAHGMTSSWTQGFDDELDALQEARKIRKMGYSPTIRFNVPPDFPWPSPQADEDG